MKLGQLVRILAVCAACVVAGASASSNSNTPATDPQSAANSPPPSQPMDPSRALGLWRSTFGAVKIEADNSRGGLQAGALQGVWEYQRQGQEVIGYFYGTLQGNVLQFRWQEPANPPLTGEGYVQFDPEGRQYSGRWWSDHRDRVGDWNGWRQAAQNPAQQQPYYPQGQGQYGGQPYGGYPQQAQPYPQQYPRQPQQYPQQPQQYPQRPAYPPQQQPYPPQQYPQQPPPSQYPQQPPPSQYPQQPPQQQPYYPPQQ